EFIGKPPTKKLQSDLKGILVYLNPFGLAGEPAPASDSTPFLLVDDPSLFQGGETERTGIDPGRWAQGTYTRAQRDLASLNLGGQPLVVYLPSGSDFEFRNILAQANVRDSQDQPGQPPYISWNYLKELTVSQSMHISTQPFLLREYARHVAEVWLK